MNLRNSLRVTDMDQCKTQEHEIQLICIIILGLNLKLRSIAVRRTYLSGATSTWHLSSYRIFGDVVVPKLIIRDADSSL
ncbi:hypothetical protein L1887_35815 [Cichorium endivia]|nr:hypothetical protein L1887_35815 [Cichorium endivia]